MLRPQHLAVATIIIAADDSRVERSSLNASRRAREAFILEVGTRTPVGGKLSLTPQTQMIYSSFRFDRFTDPAGAQQR